MQLWGVRCRVRAVPVCCAVLCCVAPARESAQPQETTMTGPCAVALLSGSAVRKRFPKVVLLVSTHEPRVDCFPGYSPETIHWNQAHGFGLVFLTALYSALSSNYKMLYFA